MLHLASFRAMLEQMRYETKGVFSMNLMISSLEYDFHSLVKVAEMAGLAGVVSFHQAGTITS